MSATRLETDASLNLRRPQEQPDGRDHWFAGGGMVVRALPSMAVVHSVGVSLGWVRTIDEAEGRALLEGLRLARGLGALSVRARVDCLRAIRMLEDGASLTDERQREVAALLKADAALFAGGVRALYAPSFHGATRRDGSQSADRLARKAAGLKDRVLRARRRRH